MLIVCYVKFTLRANMSDQICPISVYEPKQKIFMFCSVK